MSNFTITPQNYPASDGSTPLTYAIWLETSEVHEDLNLWQDIDCPGVFVAYSRSIEGAKRAITELQRID